MIAARPAGDINIFAQLNISLGSQDKEPAIAPGAQTIWGEPVHADISRTAVAVQHHVAEVLKPGMGGMIHIGDLGSGHLCSGRIRVVDELIGLMRSNIAENAAVLEGIPEPAWTSDVVHLVRRDIHRLYHFADRTCLD